MDEPTTSPQLDARAASRTQRRRLAVRAATAAGGIATLAAVLLGPAQPVVAAAAGAEGVVAVDPALPAASASSAGQQVASTGLTA
jgi:hypothetical protein